MKEFYILIGVTILFTLVTIYGLNRGGSQENHRKQDNPDGNGNN